MVDHHVPRILTSNPEGFWNGQQSHDHFTVLRKVLVRQRATYGAARVLVDLRTMLIQSQETFGHMQAEIAASYVDKDRIAIVTDRALQRLQIQRLKLPTQTRVFDNEPEARNWLETC